MKSNPPSLAIHTAKQMAAVVAASYLGAVMGLGLYTGLHKLGVRSHEIAGDKSIILVPACIAVPIVSMIASVLVSRDDDHFRLSKLGVLLSLLASYFGVFGGVVVTDAVKGSLAALLFFLWPAIGGVYSFLGYQAGRIVGRKWLSPKHVPKGAR